MSDEDEKYSNLILIHDIVKNLIRINVDSTKKGEKGVKRKEFSHKILPRKTKFAELNGSFYLVNNGTPCENFPINVKPRPYKVFLSTHQVGFSLNWSVTLRPVAVVTLTGQQRSISVFSSYQSQFKSAKNENPAQSSGYLKISIRKRRFVPKWRRRQSYDEEEAGEAEDEVEVEDAPNFRKPSHQKKYYDYSSGEEVEAEYMHAGAKPPQPRKEEDETGMTEAEKALKAQKKKHEADDAEKLREYEEQRRIQREREEEELRMLKEKQERRRQEREEEDRMMMQRRREEEDKRRAEDEARKQKAEDEKRRKEEEKRKKQAMMAGLQASNGPNFELPKKDANQEKFDKFGNIMKAKAEMGLTKQQHEEQKKRALQDVLKPLNFDGLDAAALKSKVKELHQRICKLEAVKYDLEQRQVRQDYDLKELNERQRQISRNKALKKGLDPEEAATSRHPPKVPTASKYDRQIDRRSYGDRRTLFESPKKSKDKALFHGSARPPDEWGRRVQNEELENIRKNLGPVKYVENVKADGARPPMEPVPVQAPPEEVEEE
uniref:Troponin T n=1 Tax=Romanomermis culicivorax TaxID=13658 RepID=A0A915HFG5_ROMCU